MSVRFVIDLITCRDPHSIGSANSDIIERADEEVDIEREVAVKTVHSGVRYPWFAHYEGGADCLPVGGPVASATAVTGAVPLGDVFQPSTFVSESSVMNGNRGERKI